MSIGNYLLSQDIFGHIISFNFYNKGDTHKTKIGGFVSMLVKVFFCVFIAINIKKMINYEESKTGQVQEAMDINSESLSYTDTKFGLTFALWDVLNNYAPVDYTAETKRYIRVKFLQYDADWTKQPFVYGPTIIAEARRCKRSDYHETL